MNLNSIFFPAPKSSYSTDILKGELIWIPHYKKGIKHITPLAEITNSKHLSLSFLNLDNKNSITNKRNNMQQLGPRLICEIDNTPKNSDTRILLNDKQNTKFTSMKSHLDCTISTQSPASILFLNEISKFGISSQEFNSNISHNLKEDINDDNEKAKKWNITTIKNSLNAQANENENKKEKDNYDYDNTMQTHDSSEENTNITNNDESKYFSLEDETSSINNTQTKKEYKFLRNFPKLYGAKSVDLDKSTFHNLKCYESNSIIQEDSLEYHSESINYPKFFLKSGIDYSKINSQCIDKSYTNSFSQSHYQNHDYGLSVESVHSKHHQQKYNQEHHINMSNFQCKSNIPHIEHRIDYSSDVKVNANNIDLKESLVMPSVKILPSQSPIKIVGSQRDPKEYIDFYIPCLFLKSEVRTTKLLIYFHGNGEDIKLAYDLLNQIRLNLMINIMAVEYPGYGLYKGTPNDKNILEDADYIYEYLIQRLNIQPTNLIVFGRSIGSGPATWIASRKKIAALVLMSAFTSIRGVVKDIAGSLAQYLIKERFNNIEWMHSVSAPVFFIHGLKDRLISHTHSILLKKACKSKCEIIIPKYMDHVELDFYKDFISPLGNFLEKNGLTIIEENSCINIPIELFNTPKILRNRS